MTLPVLSRPSAACTHDGTRSAGGELGRHFVPCCRSGGATTGTYFKLALGPFRAVYRGTALNKQDLHEWPRGDALTRLHITAQDLKQGVARARAACPQGSNSNPAASCPVLEASRLAGELAGAICALAFFLPALVNRALALSILGDVRRPPAAVRTRGRGVFPSATPLTDC